jgi:TonB-dependent SusC/RagA subfamily outer membrane receptor
MKTRYSLSAFIVLISVILFSCNSTAYYGNLSSKEFNQDEVATKNIQNLPLVDYLRRVPGVTVSGHGSNLDISIRGLATINGTNSPLFVIDNDPIGNSYSQAAALVDTNDIRSVLVLKDAVSTTSYGTRGSNGVIMIKTKKRESKS